MSDFITATWALATGLWWVWLFAGSLLVTSLLMTSGGVAVFDLIDRISERWHESRGYVRAPGANGKQQWVPLHPESRTANQLKQIRDLPEVRRG